MTSPAVGKSLSLGDRRSLLNREVARTWRQSGLPAHCATPASWIGSGFQLAAAEVLFHRAQPGNRVRPIVETIDPMTARAQFVADDFSDSAFQRDSSRLRIMGSEAVGVGVSHQARCFYSILDGHPEAEMIEQHLQVRLHLRVAAGGAGAASVNISVAVTFASNSIGGTLLATIAASDVDTGGAVSVSASNYDAGLVDGMSITAIGVAVGVAAGGAGGVSVNVAGAGVLAFSRIKAAQALHQLTDLALLAEGGNPHLLQRFHITG